MTKRLPARYQKVSKQSDGYKKGIRYIDYGKPGGRIRFLKHRPRL